jgi:hypothetical protein
MHSATRLQTAQSISNQHRAVKGNHVRRLEEMSWNILRHHLVDRYGLSLSDHHETVLKTMLKDFAMLTVGLKSGRIAWPLSPGAGKSQSILAFIIALDKLELSNPENGKPYPVMVTSSRVSALCELVQDLQRLGGIPEIGQSWESASEGGTGSFGLLYSAPNKDADRQPSPNAEDAQYLFTTHARVRRSRDESVAPRFDVRTLARWQGVPRMVFYDESLLVSDSWSIPKVSLFAALKSLDEYVLGHSNDDGNQPLRVEAVRCLQEEVLPLLRVELEEQIAQQRPPKLVYLPDRDYRRYREVLKPLRRVPEAIFDLLDIASRPLRVVSDKMGIAEGAFISFQIAIPSELDRVAVLDASYLVRSLCLADASMSLTNHVAVHHPVKSYETVTGHVIQHGGGRRSVERSASGDMKLLREVAEIIGTIPADEKVLLVTFMDRRGANRYNNVSIRDRFKAVLKDADVNLERVQWLTWGQETATNAFRDTPNVILAGVLHRSEWDLLGAFIGQKGDLLAQLTRQEKEDLSITESVHHAYQALHRGTCRKMRDGKAWPMRFWVFYENPKQIMKHLTRVMPGVRWERYKQQILPTFEQKQQQMADRVIDYLNAPPETAMAISCQKLREELKMMQCKRTTFFRAVNLALKSVAWEREGKSVVRKNPTDAQLPARTRPRTE